MLCKFDWYLCGVFIDANWLYVAIDLSNAKYSKISKNQISLQTDCVTAAFTDSNGNSLFYADSDA